MGATAYNNVVKNFKLVIAMLPNNDIVFETH